MLQSCIILPVPRTASPTVGSRAEIPKALIEQIGPGKSKRVDVLLLLGEPDARVDADTSFIYDWRTGRGGIGWVMLWGIPAYAASSGGVIELGNWEPVLRRWLIRFDDSGVVSDVTWDGLPYRMPQSRR